MMTTMDGTMSATMWATGEAMKGTYDYRLVGLSVAIAVLASYAALDLAGHGGFESSLTNVENLYLHELMKTEDAEEGVRAFMEKRKPEWRNR